MQEETEEGKLSGNNIHSLEVERVDRIWDGSPPERLRPLRVAYVIPHHGVTGGMKMIMEQIRLLRSRGHHVTAVARCDDTQPVLPPWTDVEADSELRIRKEENLASSLQGCDVIVAGVVTTVCELRESRVPVLYWEQGTETLFGDVPVGDRAHIWARLYETAMRQPVAVASVSPTVQLILLKRFGRRSGLILNGIDTNLFHPAAAWPGTNRVLLVGNPILPFKGFSVALEALELVARRLPDLKVTWICQVHPEKTELKNVLSKLSFPITYVVNPPQRHLPTLYRFHDALLFTSWYEAFGMPPLEAMASGVPVIATDCGGINTYARPGENCLLADPGAVDDLAFGLLTVLTERALAERLRAAGRETALRFSLEAVANQLEDALYRTASLTSYDT